MKTLHIKRLNVRKLNPATSFTLCALTLLSACSTNRLATGSDQLKAQTRRVVLADPSGPVLALDANTAGSVSRIEQQAQVALAPPIARHATQPWVGRRMVAVQSDAGLPPIFGEKFMIHFDERTHGGRVPIAVVAERLSRMTGVPVRVKQDVYTGGAHLSGAGASSAALAAPLRAPAVAAEPQVGTALPMALPTAPSTPGNAKGRAMLAASQNELQIVPHLLNEPTPDIPGGPDIAALQMRWDGSLTSFLDHVTGLLNLSWAYREGVVVIERMVTESFEVTAFGGTQDYKMNLSAASDGRGGFGSSNTSLDVQESGKLAALESLKRALETLVAATGGSVTLNEGSGRFTVVTSRDVMSRVRELVRAEDDSLRRQASIQFDIYSVVSKDSDEVGVDWTGFVTELMKTWSGTLKTPASLVGSGAGSLAYTLATAPDAQVDTAFKNTATRYGGSTALLQALHKMGDSAQYRPISMVAMNRQWARKTNLKVTGYVAETTPATSAGTGSGSPGLKTASVTTGDKFLVQPAIMNDGTVFLKFGVSLTDLLGLFNVSAGSGPSLQTVQTPETSGTDDQGTIRLNAGETMLITGLSRRVADSDRQGFAEEIPIALGGSKRRSYRREDFLIAVRATPL